MKQTLLVTGAGGFLGRELLSQLCRLDNYNLFALTSNKSKLSDLFNNAPNIKILGNEALDNKEVPLNEIDVVLHCAFSRSNNGKDLTKSLIFTQKVLTDAMMHNCAVINVSSRSVYGQNPNTPWKEETLVEPDSLYALAKFSSELLLQGIASISNKARHTSLRLAGLVGPELDARIINKFIDQALKGEALLIKGGNQQFAYLDVRDAATGIITLLQMPAQAWKSVYNLGHQKSYSIIQIADLVAKTARNYNCPEVKIHLEKTNDMLHAEMDSTLFYYDTGWRPTYDMETIIKAIFEYKISKRSE